MIVLCRISYCHAAAFDRQSKPVSFFVGKSYFGGVV